MPVRREGARPAGGAAGRGAATPSWQEFVAQVWRARDDRYSELRTEANTSGLPKVEMSHIGG
ncbi:hypothetical protein O0235_10490 [Tepidiforma flava]|uniref:Uncharacterized protein n=1 Tax=Tepidiforma flava TaxID=3004094 RepID=A0ABY7M607_9CHLR|nr:hypothetical protein [Tepidiforma flava]WBL35216.1 hypothetical protein O0235_10490 [Tepidiforma flava]